MKNLRVMSFHQSIDILEMQADEDFSSDDYFCSREIALLKNRHFRSQAGWLALKRALIDLLFNQFSQKLKERDIELDLLETGEPVIHRIQKMGRVDPRIYVSISHSQYTAHGLAVIQGEHDG